MFKELALSDYLTALVAKGKSVKLLEEWLSEEEKKDLYAYVKYSAEELRTTVDNTIILVNILLPEGLSEPDYFNTEPLIKLNLGPHTVRILGLPIAGEQFTPYALVKKETYMQHMVNYFEWRINFIKFEATADLSEQMKSDLILIYGAMKERYETQIQNKIYTGSH